MGVDHTGYTVVVDVWFMARHDALHANDALVFCLVSQHGSLNAITDGVDTFASRLEILVNFNASTFVHLDT